MILRNVLWQFFIVKCFSKSLFFFSNKSLSNLEILLILRRFFQWCRRIFPNLSMSKVEKTRGRVYFVYPNPSLQVEEKTINLSSPTNSKVGQSDFWDFPGSVHIFPRLPGFNSPFVEGLNVINGPKCNKVLNVITFCPKCNKVLNVITFCPKCNKLLSCQIQ